jgi:hypothetical protein
MSDFNCGFFGNGLSIAIAALIIILVALFILFAI